MVGWDVSDIQMGFGKKNLGFGDTWFQ
jgi:hypothetical protein